MFRGLVVFPDALDLGRLPDRRLNNFRVAVSFDTGLVGHLVVKQRTVPEPADLEELVPTLLEALGNDYPLLHASDLIADRHGLLAEMVDDPLIDPQVWRVEQVIAQQLALQVSRGSPEESIKWRHRMLGATRARLTDSLAGLLATLDPEILAVTGTDARLRPSRYNFLAAGDPQLRRNRMQAVKAYPWLFSSILWNEGAGRIAMKIRSAIDNGERLGRVLSDLLQCSPSVIRMLSSCPASLLETEFKHDIPLLARTLETLIPERRPKTNDDWLRFSRAIATIEKASGSPISRPQNQCWLAAAACREFDVSVGETVGMGHLMSGVMEVRDAMRAVLALMIAGAETWEVAWLERNPGVASVIDRVIGQAIGRVDLVRLAVMVRRWEAEYRRQEALGDADSAVISGRRWPAPLDELRTEQWIVVPILTPYELAEEGVTMHHCVGSYVGDCRRGSVQVWSIRTLAGQRRSTLATRFVRRKGGGWWPEVCEHRATMNKPPDSLSRAAANVLLKRLESNDPRIKAFWEWQCTTARIALEDRGTLIATRIKMRALESVLPRRIALDRLAAEISDHLALLNIVKPLR